MDKQCADDVMRLRTEVDWLILLIFAITFGGLIYWLIDYPVGKAAIALYCLLICSAMLWTTLKIRKGLTNISEKLN